MYLPQLISCPVIRPRKIVHFLSDLHSISLKVFKIVSYMLVTRIPYSSVLDSADPGNSESESGYGSPSYTPKLPRVGTRPTLLLYLGGNVST